MNPILRTPHAGDRDRIRAALDIALYLSPPPKETTHQRSTVDYLADDPAYAVELIIQNAVDAYIINESHLLVYTVIKPWYCKNNYILAEEMVLRIGDGGHFGDVIQTLEGIAEDHDCQAIVAGGALARSSKAITRLYRRYGYELETDIPQLTKRRK